ncbi:HRDC-like protein [Trametes meyenii]|nr:HRDC-like protein [Trametes meyenii]
MTLRHRPAHEEEDASALRLGPEFNNAGCLLISEVRYLLEHRPSEKAAPDTTVYKKTLEYVKTFAKFDKPEAAAAIRETLRRESALTQFEIAQIANLCPVTAEEAKSIVPRSKTTSFSPCSTRYKPCGNSNHDCPAMRYRNGLKLDQGPV